MTTRESHPRERFVAIVRRPYTGEPSRHYVGMPPLDPDDPDTRERMDVARLLVLESGSEGIFLDRYDELGGDAGDPWHQSPEEAKEQAVAEYGDKVGPWTEVPDGEADPVAFGFRLAEAGSSDARARPMKRPEGFCYDHGVCLVLPVVCSASIDRGAFFGAVGRAIVR